MFRIINTIAYRLYAILKVVLTITGLSHSRVGSKFVGWLNAMGCLGTRLFLLFERHPVIVDGHRMYLAYRRSPSFSFSTNMCLGRYERETTNLFKRLIRRGMVVVDVGAHVGYYTLLAARLVGPEGKVYAFEPEPENYATLQKNVGTNGYGNVTLVPRAVSDRTDKVKLFLSSQGNDRHSIYPNPRSCLREPSIEVATINLDEFLAAEGRLHVDLIKMDIEGAELLALQGMHQLLSRSNDVKLIVEFAPVNLQASGFAPGGLLERLVALGFTLTSIEEDGSLNRLEAADFPSFVSKIAAEGVRNLLCEKVVVDPPGRDGNESS